VLSPNAGPQSDALQQLRSGLQMMALRALGDLEAAEEAVQETLVRALESLRDNRLRDPDKLGAYVWGIARHVIAKTRDARRRVVPLDALPEAQRGTNPTDPLAALVTAEERERVRRSLAQLSAGDREILHLSFFEGLTAVEIAERLGEPALRIRKRKSRALRRLRQAFLRAGDGRHESSTPRTSE
jgi:RNA polymerase sigma-70 factor (ECF subfamily)